MPDGKDIQNVYVLGRSLESYNSRYYSQVERRPTDAPPSPHGRSEDRKDAMPPYGQTHPKHTRAHTLKHARTLSTRTRSSTFHDTSHTHAMPSTPYPR